ncbi:MAG: hypothetical protein RMX65_026870 [Nostoc sp. DedQUE01]|nr:hypothetical protein [Nostoc sp. DedQUE01]
MLKKIKEKFPLPYNICYENYIGLTKNPRWLLMRKVSRFRIGRLTRDFFNRKNKYVYQKNVNNNSSLFPDIDVDVVVNSLNKNAFYLGINLPKEIVKK